MARWRQDESESNSAALIAAFREQSPAEVRHYRGDFYIWERGRYRLVERGFVEHMIYRLFASYERPVTARMIHEMVDALAIKTFIDGGKSPPFWEDEERSANVLVMNNGILDIDKQELLPHDPSLFAVAGADYDFDASAACPLWLGFLPWFASGDQAVVELLGRFLAWVLLPSLQLQRFLWLSGDGNNGKSVFVNVVARLIGESNCGRIPLERFSSRFSLVELVGKRLNIVADTEETDKVSEALLKQLVGGDPMALERKFKNLFACPLSTRLIFSANTVARFRDRSDGIWRRLIVLPCRAVVAPEQRVIGFDDVLSAELPGILNWVLSHVAPLLERRALTIPPICEQALSHCRSESSPARLFCAEQLRLSCGTFASSASVYAHYRHWMSVNGFAGTLMQPNFFKELTRVYTKEIAAGDVKRVRGKGAERSWGYRGLVLLEKSSVAAGSSAPDLEDWPEPPPAPKPEPAPAAPKPQPAPAPATPKPAKPKKPREPKLTEKSGQRLLFDYDEVEGIADLLAELE